MTPDDWAKPRLPPSLGSSAMRTFKVVKEPHGWSVRLGEAMATPFWARDLAIQEANCLCQALLRHGESAEVVIEGIDPADPLGTSGRPNFANRASRLRNPVQPDVGRTGLRHR